jgi:hypothetical protein
MYEHQVVTKENFQALIAQTLSTTDDGALEDTTAQATRESQFAPISRAEADEMGSMLAEMAATATQNAINTDALAESTDRKITRVPLHKISGSKTFFRLKQDKAYFAQGVRLLETEDGMSRTLYLVKPNVDVPACAEKQLKTCNIYTGLTITKDVFLLYIPCPTVGRGNGNSWWESAVETMRLAMRNWIKVQANTTTAGYDYFPTRGAVKDPDWTVLPSFNELLIMAFRGHVIDSENHPVIQRLLGNEDVADVYDDGSL